MARFAPSQATSKIYMYVYAENIFRQLPPNVKKEWYIFCLLLVFLWVYRAIGTVLSVDRSTCIGNMMGLSSTLSLEEF
jgi:hypothetical protein